jgi:hypothetical protein
MQKTETNLKTGEVRVIDLTAEEIAAASALNAADTKAQPLRTIAYLEERARLTHRGFREFFIGFGESFPQFKETHLYKEAKRVDDLIRAERAKL